ncbi:MAG: isocitrate lyase/phosphoenolpyruvate mutase family protein [Chloroflexota bacterium]|nr:isocitrate lyase/phosphoenolpyruvate mutase family protein [Chloroflexota bacterium]
MRPAERLRELLGSDICTTVAQVYDTLSARIAAAVGWEVCKLAGKPAKAANLGVPDDVGLADLADLAMICRAITRVAHVSLVVDADDAGPTPLTARRTVEELEAAGAAAIEIQDDVGGRMVPTKLQVAKLRSALAARREGHTVITARTAAVDLLPMNEALERIRAYASAGVDAIMLPGWRSRPIAQIQAVASACELPLCVSGLEAAAMADPSFLVDARIRFRYLDHYPYRMAVKALYDGFAHLKSGGSADELRGSEAPDDVLRLVTRASDFAEWERTSRR